MGKMRVVEITDSNIDEINDLMTIKKQPGKGTLVSVPEPMISKLQGVDNEVDGYPMIRFLVGGKKKKDYNGKREVKDLAKFVKKSLGKCRKTSKKKTKRR